MNAVKKLVIESWRCKNHRNSVCKASARTQFNQVIENSGIHNHPAKSTEDIIFLVSKIQIFLIILRAVQNLRAILL